MNILTLLASMLLFSVSANGAEPCSDLLNYKMTKLRSSEELDFCQAFHSKVILAVNTASNCGYTPQFKGLEALYQKYNDKLMDLLQSRGYLFGEMSDASRMNF
jgi:glutathione peroxidase